MRIANDTTTATVTTSGDKAIVSSLVASTRTSATPMRAPAGSAGTAAAAERCRYIAMICRDVAPNGVVARADSSTKRIAPWPELFGERAADDRHGQRGIEAGLETCGVAKRSPSPCR